MPDQTVFDARGHACHICSSVSNTRATSARIRIKPRFAAIPDDARRHVFAWARDAKWARAKDAQSPAGRHCFYRQTPFSGTLNRRASTHQRAFLFVVMIRVLITACSSPVPRTQPQAWVASRATPVGAQFDRGTPAHGENSAEEDPSVALRRGRQTQAGVLRGAFRAQCAVGLLQAREG